MVRVRALETTVGEYGTLRRGQEADVRPSVAKELSLRGILEIIGEDDGKEPDEKEVKGGIRIKDNVTGEMIMDSKIIKDDRKSVTGEPTEAERAAQKKIVKESEPEKKVVTHEPKKEYK